MAPEQFERLQELLRDLEPHIKNMTGSSPQFVRDQIDRAEQYGVNMRLSPKQTEWLEGLYSKHCRVTMNIMQGNQPTKEARRDALGDDMDDDIPF